MTILTSLLDTDLYKLTMMQVVFHQFPSAKVKYAFKCRTKGADLHCIAARLEEEIAALCRLTFSKEELDYLRTLRFMKADFVDFLEIFRLQEKHVQIVKLPQGEIDIQIEGPWLHTILFEVPVLALVNELYFERNNTVLLMEEGSRRLFEKIDLLKTADVPGFKFSDFGTRRRFSKVWQKEVVNTLKDALPTQFTGTSNVLLAKELGLVPIGTMAHEYLQAFQALGGRLVDSQKNALDAWAKEYRGDLGIALTDVVGIDAFLRDFDMFFCKLFDGVRHDSGNPVEWMDKMLAHYKKNRVDARTKSFVFSDGLTMTSAIALYSTFHEQGQLFFGIGTHLTNDVGVEPLNVVLKMTECNGQPVAKLSDSPGKSMCKDVQYMDYLKHVFEKE
jgi:nicotinate phosphoribosyltransferase